MVEENTLFSVVQRMLQIKQVHVLYAAEKAEKLYTRMSAIAGDNEMVADGTTEMVNQMYSLQTRLKNKMNTLTPREKRYGKKVISLLNGLIEENERIQGRMVVSARVIRCMAYSLQLNVLKVLHYQWREKVYMSILGKDILPVQDEYDCALGHWYHGEGRKTFGSLPVFLRLGVAHGKLHQALVAVIQVSGGDKTQPEQTLLKLEVLETFSHAVVTALDELDDFIIRLGMTDGSYIGLQAFDPVYPSV